MGEKWCKIVEIDGKQVLFQNRWNNEDDEYEMRVTVRGSDWVDGSPVTEASMAISREDKPYTDKEFFLFTAQEHTRKIIDNIIKQYANFGKDADNEGDPDEDFCDD